MDRFPAPQATETSKCRMNEKEKGGCAYVDWSTELGMIFASIFAITIALWVINMFYRKVNTETIRGNLELFRSEPKGLFAAWCESVSLQTCCRHSPRSPEQKRSEPGYQRRACSSPRYPWPNEAFSILWVSAFGSHTPESSPATNCPGEWP